MTIAAENARFGQTGPKVGSFDGGFGASDGDVPYGGYLSGPGADAKVISLFAGVTCHFG